MNKQWLNVIERSIRDEKLAGRSVKKDRLAMKTLPGGILKINREQYRVPDSGYLDMALDAISNIGHRYVLVIENYRCFDALDRMPMIWSGRSTILQPGACRVQGKSVLTS